MKYKGFYIEISPDEHIIRSDSNGKDVACQGFNFTVFADEGKSEKIDEFTAAVGFELLQNSLNEAEQFAKDVVGCDIKENLEMSM